MKDTFREIVDWGRLIIDGFFIFCFLGGLAMLALAAVIFIITKIMELVL